MLNWRYTGFWRANATRNPELFDSIHKRSSTPVTVHHHTQRLKTLFSFCELFNDDASVSRKLSRRSSHWGVLNWEQCGRKLWSPNRVTIPECASGIPAETKSVNVAVRACVCCRGWEVRRAGWWKCLMEYAAEGTNWAPGLKFDNVGTNASSRKICG
jgi:hypothetical protein